MLCLTVSGAALHAQATATSSVSGRVFEIAPGKSLQRAIVRAAGTTSTHITDADGRYHLSGVPAGRHTIEAEYVGLDPVRQQVSVSASGHTALDAGLKSEVLRMAAFEVAEAARGQALAINQQKTARGIVNIVSEETFGAMNEGNIGYALQRLPGLLVSATFTDSVANYPDRPGEKLPTYGFSHYMFNASADYVLGNFRSRLTYRYRSQYLEGIDANKYLDDWFAPREQLDAEVSYRLRKNIRLTVSGENLTSRVQASYQGYLPYIEDNSNYGWRATFGMDVTF